MGLWGVLTTGCRPPIFTISVNWKAMVTGLCQQPYIYVTSIVEDTAFDCMMQFTANELRTLGQPSSPALLQGLLYAMSPALAGGRILNSVSHTQTIMDCIFPSNTYQFSTWGKWSSASPGICSPCLAQQFSITSSTPISRPCNQSAGEFADCCFTCRDGYTILTFTSATTHTQQQQCLKNCAPGYTFDNPTYTQPNCVPCPQGTFTDGKGICKPCTSLGFSSNAVVMPSSRQGCVECGGRAKAVANQCVPCPSQFFLPPGGLVCRPCDPGYVLKTAASEECTPCPVGFFADVSNRCLQCPLNTFKRLQGAGSCQPCPSGMQSVLNRSVCVPCTDIDHALAPWAIYKPNISGCGAMCNQSVSYAAGTNPYTAGGCRPCSLLPVPIGHALLSPAHSSTTVTHRLGRHVPQPAQLRRLSALPQHPCLRPPELHGERQRERHMPLGLRSWLLDCSG